MASSDVRVGVHSEALKFGRVPDPTKATLAQHLQNSSVAIQAMALNITTIGYKLTYAQDRALFAVQRLFDSTNYQGNSTPVPVQRSAVYRFQGDLPVMDIKTSQYFDMNGVKKIRYGSKMIYDPQPRRISLNALKDLALTDYLLVYDKTISAAKKKQKVRVEVIAPLLNLQWSNGNRRVRIIPNPILVDQIDSYFILRPEDFFTANSSRDVVHYRFLEYLSYHNFQKAKAHAQSRELRVEQETIAWWLRLDSLVRARKKAMLRSRLTKLYQEVVNRGSLRSFQINQQGTKHRIVDVLDLI